MEDWTAGNRDSKKMRSFRSLGSIGHARRLWQVVRDAVMDVEKPKRIWTWEIKSAYTVALIDCGCGNHEVGRSSRESGPI